MKLYKYTAMAMSGNIDPYIVHNNLSKHYDNISYYNPFNKNYMGKKGDPAVHPIDGVKIDKMFSGRTVTKQDGVKCEFGLDINVEIFSERCVVMQELIFDFKDKQAFDVMIKKLNDNFIFEEVLSWQTGSETLDCSIISFSNTFIMEKLIPIFTNEDIKKIFDEYDPTDKKGGIKYRRKLKEFMGLNVDLCGSMGMNTLSSNWNTSVILDEDEQIDINDSHEKYSEDNKIYYLNLIDSYVCLEPEVLKKFLSDFRNYNLYLMFIKGYTISLQMWSSSLNKEAEELILNLDSQNEVFWQNMRMKVEEWQLHFLAQNSKRTRSLSQAQQTNLLKFFTITKQKRDEWLDEVRKKEKIMQRYIDEVKYNLDNMATPGHTHDEQTLQKESETTNERILLLSFLAMSIPMLGAIFSPAFTFNTKIISASVLLCLPIVYFFVIRISKSRQKALNTRRDLIRRRKDMQQYLGYHESNIEEIKSNEKLADDAKDEIIKWEKENIKLGQSMIDKINKKIK